MDSKKYAGKIDWHRQKKRRFTMSTAKILTDKEIAELKKRPIDFSDIPELTTEQAKELYPRNWRLRKQVISATESV